ncbi:MAG: hypothetical protein U9O98_06160, partial [Asgard group archaeon]|nr:hypothetical protein [Asgard group archaeon]
MAIHGLFYAEFDLKKGPQIKSKYPEDFNLNFSSEDLAKIAVQSMGLYNTQKESFNVFMIKDEIIAVSFVKKILREDIERGMSMVSLILLLSKLNPLLFKMKIMSGVNQLVNQIESVQYEKPSFIPIIKKTFSDCIKIASNSSLEKPVSYDSKIEEIILEKYNDLVEKFHDNPIEALNLLKKRGDNTKLFLYHLGYLAAYQKWLEDHKRLLEIGARTEFNFSLILNQELIPRCKIFGNTRRGSAHSVSIYNNILVENNISCIVIEGYIAGILRV